MEEKTKVVYRNLKRNEKTKSAAVSVSRKDCDELGMTNEPMYVKVTIEPVPKEQMPSSEASTATEGGENATI